MDADAGSFTELTRLGVTSGQALEAATVTAAGLFGLADEIGTVEVGARADIIAVASDSLQDVRAVADVAFVIRTGRS